MGFNVVGMAYDPGPTRWSSLLVSGPRAAAAENIYLRGSTQCVIGIRTVAIVGGNYVHTGSLIRKGFKGQDTVPGKRSQITYILLHFLFT